MGILVKLELQKCIRNKKNIILFIGCVAFLFIIALQNIQKDMNYEQTIRDHMGSASSFASEYQSSLEMELQLMYQEVNVDAKKIKELQKEYDFWTEEMENTSLIKGLYTHYGTWYGEQQAIAEAIIQRNRTLIQGLQDGYRGMRLQTGGVDTEITALENEIAILEKLMNDHAVQLEQDSGYVFMYHSPYEMNVLNFLATVFADGNMLFIAILILFMLLDLYTSEVETGSYKMYYTGPVKRRQLILAKAATAVIVSFGTVFLSLLIVMAILSLFYGFGDLRYPYVVEEALEPCFVYVGRQLSLAACFVIFLALLFMLVSVFMTSTSTMAVVSSSILLAVYFAYQSFGFQIKWMSAIPLFFLYVDEIVQGNGVWGVYVCCALLLLCSVLIAMVMNRYFAVHDIKDGE